MQATTTLTNVQLVKDCYRLFNEGKVEDLLNLVSDNVQWIVPGPREIPYAGIRDGKQSVRQFFKQVQESIDITKMEPREFIEQGERVIVLGTWEAKVRKTGKPARSEWAMAFTVKNERVTRFQEYSDTHNTAEAFRAPTGKSSGN